MWSGEEYFYPAIQRFLERVAEVDKILDVGTPTPFQKDMSVLKGRISGQYYFGDYTVGVTAGGVRLDAMALPFRSASVGAVLLSQVLEHLPDPVQALREARRVLKPGGLLYVTLLMQHPYHPSGDGGSDVFRFQRDAPRVLFRDWAAVEVVEAGNVLWASRGYSKVLQSIPFPVLNALDPRIRRPRLHDQLVVLATA